MATSKTNTTQDMLETSDSRMAYTKSQPVPAELAIKDSRTQREYRIPITNNAIRAMDFKAITAPRPGAGEETEQGIRILDPGFGNTAPMDSEITLVDGEKGTIHYRQYDIEYLFHNHEFEEVVYLLSWGHLPSREETVTFRRQLVDLSTPPQMVLDVIAAFPIDAPRSTIIQAALSAWTASYPESVPIHVGRVLYSKRLSAVDIGLTRCISAIFTTVALIYCRSHSRTLTAPLPHLNIVENFLLMIGHVEPSTGLPSPVKVRRLSRLWILFADHEMTNSTAAFLHVGSTLADPLSCLVAAVASAFGPLHAGALSMAYETYKRVESPENVPSLIEDVKAGKMRLFGFGHRLYRAVDPRARLVMELIKEMEPEMRRNPLLDVALEVEKAASRDEYFVSRRLVPSIDLYGCLCFTALGFPDDMVLALACSARVPGAVAHWREQQERSPRIWRPQQIYVGEAQERRSSKL